jgi:hypothetical protein
MLPAPSCSETPNIGGSQRRGATPGRMRRASTVPTDGACAGAGLAGRRQETRLINRRPPRRPRPPAHSRGRRHAGDRQGQSHAGPLGHDPHREPPVGVYRAPGPADSAGGSALSVMMRGGGRQHFCAVATKEGSNDSPTTPCEPRLVPHGHVGIVLLRVPFGLGRSG